MDSCVGVIKGVMVNIQVQIECIKATDGCLGGLIGLLEERQEYILEIKSFDIFI